MNKSGSLLSERGVLPQAYTLLAAGTGRSIILVKKEGVNYTGVVNVPINDLALAQIFFTYSQDQNQYIASSEFCDQLADGITMYPCEDVQDGPNVTSQPYSGRIVFSAGCNSSGYNGRLQWAHVRVPNEGVVSLDDNRRLRIEKSGTYLIFVQLLNTSGYNLYPIMFIDDVPVMYGYGSGSGYQTASIPTVISITAGQVLSVGLQGCSGSIYSHSSHEYSSLFIIEL
jgi:hypothetical protein